MSPPFSAPEGRSHGLGSDAVNNVADDELVVAEDGGVGGAGDQGGEFVEVGGDGFEDEFAEVLGVGFGLGLRGRGGFGGRARGHDGLLAGRNFGRTTILASRGRNIHQHFSCTPCLAPHPQTGAAEPASSW